MPLINPSMTGRPPDEANRQTDAEAQRDEEIDEASAQSFPASDAPSSTSAHAGPPARPDASGPPHMVPPTKSA